MHLKAACPLRGLRPRGGFAPSMPLKSLRPLGGFAPSMPLKGCYAAKRPLTTSCYAKLLIVGMLKRQRDGAAGMERGGWWGVCVRACRGVGGGVIHALEVLLLVNSWVGAWGKGSWNWMLCPVRSLQSLRDRTQNPCRVQPPRPLRVRDQTLWSRDQTPWSGWSRRPP